MGATQTSLCDPAANLFLFDLKEAPRFTSYEKSPFPDTTTSLAQPAGLLQGSIRCIFSPDRVSLCLFRLLTSTWRAAFNLKP